MGVYNMMTDSLEVNEIIYFFINAIEKIPQFKTFSILISQPTGY